MHWARQGPAAARELLLTRRVRMLITGAGGTLGVTLAPMAAAQGHEPVLLDIQPLDTPFESIVGDIRNAEDVRRAMDGIEIVVHAAAIHGIHLRDHTPQQFHDLNLTGTFNTWQAAADAGVKGLVFSSTMGVYGKSGAPPTEDSVVALHEDQPLLPGDIYGFTKVAGEEMCRYYLRRYGIPSVALRYGMFVPEPYFHSGIRLLYGGVDARDVARAVLTAADALVAGDVEWDAFNVESLVPFSVKDGSMLRSDVMAVIGRYYPGADELLRARGVPRLNAIHNYYPMDRIADRLAYRPEHNFDDWLEDLRSRSEERAPEKLPWW